MSEQRFTLTLPSVVYNELKEYADRRDASIAEVTRQVLKFGLVALKLDEDPNTDLIVREKIPQANGNGGATVVDTRLKFIF